MQYIPEMGGGREGAEEATKTILKIRKLLLDKLDYIGSSNYIENTTKVWFRDNGDYDAFLAGNL